MKDNFILALTLMQTALLVSLIALTSCTYSITMVHTEGQASDVVDETLTNTPKVDPVLSIPAI